MEGVNNHTQNQNHHLHLHHQQKSLDRVVSYRAFQMSNSFPCQVCVVGFLCGVCLTSLFLAALTSFGGFEFSGLSISPGNLQWNSIGTNAKYKLKESEKRVQEAHTSKTETEEENIALLYSAWDAILAGPISDADFFQKFGLNKSNIPNAPHLEKCRTKALVNNRVDTRVGNASFPPWTSWKGLLDMHPATTTNEQLRHYRHEATSEGLFPPWVMGSDEENYPLTRKVQRDIWIHQHPVDCKAPNVKFIIADWERLPGFGIGAQIASMCGLLALAINENRVLVTSYYNRADHDGCKDASWSCYFFPETSQECRDRAFELMGSTEAWDKGVIRVKENYTSKEIWTGRIPRVWGDPWSYMQPTTEINGSFVTLHRKMDRRWWRAQAVRYLMRFPTEYTCRLLNIARHAAFGKEAAKMVISNIGKQWIKETIDTTRSDIEDFVWSSHKPWIPQPLLSIHVRMGDKACEMKVVEFKEYMSLAGRIRNHFPHLHSIWLSTEMQEVIDKSKQYTDWNFYYTNVPRQAQNMSMAKYEASLGRETSTNYPLVNFLMAADADFFIGALGSTWCFLIDGMRNTGGKVMAGYLSVNKDRFW